MSFNNIYNFQRLTPVQDAKLDVYEDAFKFIFDNDDVRNIAVSGAYCAGKSSILGSYEVVHEEHKFLHISLAHFKTGDLPKKDKVQNPTLTLEAKIEGKIVNQLIHQIPSDKIQETNFKIKNRYSKEFSNKISKRIAESVLYVSYLISSPNIENLLCNFLDSKWSSIIIFFLNTLVIFRGLWLLKDLINFIIGKQLNNNLIKRVNINGNELELLGEQNDSYFDKFLNEVLYLFENVDADAIVFEDLDRFNLGIIFERLREINTLVNIKLKDKDKSLKFFYLLRDDIFESKERTKFFDFIMPIVPVIDNSNSYNRFKDIVENGHREETFDDEFLKQLSKYVDDMRILKNIYNEYLFYYELLHIEPENCNKMLAMITYKNIFPKDFSDLQLGRGYVFELFSQSFNYIEKEIDKNNYEINRLENKDLSDNTRWFELNPERTMNNSYLYDENTLRRENLQRKINDLSIRQIELESYSLKDFLKQDDCKSIFMVNYQNSNDNQLIDEFKDIKDSNYFGLLKYLITNGYIAEDYNRYMTYSYTNE